MKTKIETAFAVINAISIFLFMQPFYVWPTYPNYQVFLIIQYLNLFIGIAFCSCLNIVELSGVTKSKMLGILVFFLFISFYYCTGEKSQIGRWGVLAQYVFMFLFICYNNDKVKIKSFEIFRKCFAVILIPAIIVFLLKIIGMNLPYEIIRDYNAGGIRDFLHYPYSFSILTANIASIHLPSLRLCGPLDEPGALGTFVSLILISKDLDLKDKYNRILFIAGCLTLSTAFFILIAGYVILAKVSLNKLAAKRMKAYFFVAVLLLLAFLILVLIVRPDYFQKIWNRIFLKLSIDDLRGTNAILEQTRIEFGGNIMNYLFGKGYFSGVFGASASWTILLHDVGIIGIILLTVYILGIESNKKIVWKSFVFRILMLASVTQRPHILTISYVLIFSIGIIELENPDVGKQDCTDIAEASFSKPHDYMLLLK